MFILDEILKATKGKLVLKGKTDTFDNVSIDSRTVQPKEIFIAIKGPNFDGHDFIREAISKGAFCVIAYRKDIVNQIARELKDSNLTVSIVCVDSTQQALVDLASYNHKRFPVPILAITGTNGKTTTKDMTADILSLDYNVLKTDGTQNNKIGVCQSLLRLDKNHDIAVLEFGTNHVGEIEGLTKIARPNIGVITNIGPGHLEFLSDKKTVFKEKRSLLQNLKEPAAAIINIDDAYLSSVSNKKRFSFGIINKCDIEADDISGRKGKLSFTINKKHKFILNSIARHNVYNALAAVTSGLIFGVDINRASKILSEFKFPESRLNILNINNITVLDDTYNSNPASLKAAIEALHKYPTSSHRILVMADMLELGKRSLDLHRNIGEIVARSNIDHLITLGNFSSHAGERAKQICKDSKTIAICDSHEQVTSMLLNMMADGDVVLIKGSRGMEMEKIIENLKNK